MTGKSKHKGGKQTSGKKKKTRHHISATVVRQPVVTQNREAVSMSSVPTASARTSTAAAKQIAVRNPYIANELRTIGILAGIMLAILIVLALVLS